MPCQKCGADSSDVCSHLLHGKFACVLCRQCAEPFLEHIDAAAQSWLAEKPEGGVLVEAAPPELRPIDVAVALSLYQYNVNPGDRALAVHRHFEGNCAGVAELIRQVSRGYGPTELAPPSAKVYVDQAIARYGEEAARWNRGNGI